MKCGRCAADNPDSAIFCGKCAGRLRTGSSARTINRQVISAPQSATDVLIESEPSFSKKCGDAPPPSHRRTHVRQVAAPLSSTSPLANLRADDKHRSLVAYAMLAIALSGSVAIWWTFGRTAPRVVPLAEVVIAASAPLPAATMVPDVELAAAALQPSPTEVALENSAASSAVVGANANKDPTSQAKVARGKILRPPALRHKAKRRITPASKLTSEVALNDQRRLHEAASRQYQDESSRAARLKITQQTPQQACADRTNFISRGICEARECEKPERTSLKFCADMLARRAPRDYPN